MISSMTAFSRIEKSGAWGSAAWELRSVNHRFLEMSVRLPEELRALEPAVRERIAARIGRGKLDCSLRRDAGAGVQRVPRVDLELAAAVVAAAGSLPLRDPAPINPLELLRWPGVLDAPPADAGAHGAALLELLDEALAGLVETRRREGAKIRQLIEERCAAARTLVTALRPQVPALVAALRERLRQRARELAVELDPDRLEQEILLLSQRLDVDEELDRMNTHIEEVSRVLRQREPVGRRLDFLMQELNREANTLGSKAGSMELTGAAVELKVLIEQMREQVQNVE